MAITQASLVADATIMTDNGRKRDKAFTVCRVQLKESELYDIRTSNRKTPAEILQWVDKVAPFSVGGPQSANEGAKPARLPRP
jgi:hypothetical protein